MSQHKMMKTGGSKQRNARNEGAAFTVPENCPCLKRFKVRVVFKTQDSIEPMRPPCVDENGNETECPTLVPVFSVEGTASHSPGHCPCLERLKVRVLLEQEASTGTMGLKCVDENGNETECPTGLVPVVPVEEAVSLEGSVWCPCLTHAWGLAPKEETAGVKGLPSRPMPFFTQL
ncbi:hypothetical protein ATI61_104585 [Archangium gephyra]|uniref:Uncharacterized protein n=1 Tax=Archangium gephyra TaxID=48 RepID=A0AAC8TBS1_9BACT|nr:hypothetical protein [Archangium gephyra]AKI99997.1 Hypothetical protein AA314_01624 [Archangium gephyra]REG33294.1 hypothetical protein ATI61_104585 [Archangium gephyra]